MSTQLIETKENLLADLRIETVAHYELLDKLTETGNRYLKDLKINVSNALNSSNVNKKESYLIAFAVAVNENHEALKHSFERLAKEEGVSEEEIAEVIACVSLLNVNNVFYRFKHFVHKDYYDSAPAGIKMSIMMNPILGKEFFELLSLVISALNGCELCVTSHEESVIKHGATQARVFDSIRLGAIIKGLVKVLQ